MCQTVTYTQVVAPPTVESELRAAVVQPVDGGALSSLTAQLEEIDRVELRMGLSQQPAASQPIP